jgi:hypothetical protein
MNAMTPQRQNLNCVRIAGVSILVIAVWGTLGLHAQNLPETAGDYGSDRHDRDAAVPIAAPRSSLHRRRLFRR